jgi:nucleoside-diphosphate-sugar epimerase
MIVGNGLMASVFKEEYKNRDDIVIFASGVSNSLETDIDQFYREENLLVETLNKNKDKRIVYFSSFVDLCEQKREYFQHKLYMEFLIQDSGNDFLILRLSQVVGNGGNKNTLLNFICRKLKMNEEIIVYKKAYRSLIDVDDVKRIVDIVLDQQDKKCIYMAVPFIEKLLVKEIVNLVARWLNIIPKIKLVEIMENDFPELKQEVKTMLKDLGIVPKGYTERIIKKYV